MPRSYAHIVTTIWERGGDFRRLSGPAKLMYFQLITQPDISAAGTLGLRMRHWASMGPDTTEDTIHAALKELAAARFVVVDEVTQELLVRTFVRWDGGYGNRKRRPAIINAALAVDSPELRAALAVEFALLGLPTQGLGGPAAGQHDDLGLDGGWPVVQQRLWHDDLAAPDPPRRTDGFAGKAEDARPSPAHRVAESSERVEPPEPVDVAGHPGPEVPGDWVFGQVEGLSASSGVVGCEGPYVAPATGNTQPAARSPHPAGVPAPTAPPRRLPAVAGVGESERVAESVVTVLDGVNATDRIIDGWIGRLRCRPQRVIADRIRAQVAAALADGQDPDDVAVALGWWQARPDLGPNALPLLIHDAATRADRVGGVVVDIHPRHRSRADDRQAGAMALIARLEAEERAG